MPAITIPYRPRAAFKPLHQRPQRFAVGVAHRRAGKTVACINELIKGALSCARPQPRFAYIAPFFVQAKDIAWEYVKHYSRAVPGVKFHESELRVDFPNGARVRLYGADNPERLRGLYLDGVVLDEYAQMSPRLWTEVIRPSLADRQGWVVFIGTPMGRNAFCKLYEQAKLDPTWFTFRLKASETGLLPLDELAAAQLVMSPDQYAQEFECSFQAAVQGAYYGEMMNRLEQQGALATLSIQPDVPVHTAWDLGIGDSTVIWFYQQQAGRLAVVDYVEASGVGLDYYASQLAAKPYKYGEHLLPHDAEVRELGTGRSRLETLKQLGIKGRIVPKLALEDGINAVRQLLPQCQFDINRCARGIEALRQYRREWDDKGQTFRASPLHDWASHAADAFRYLAVGWRDRTRLLPTLGQTNADYNPFGW